MRTFFLSVLFFTLTSVASAHAAELLLYSSHAPIEGESLVIQARLDTAHEIINALEGALSYPATLQLREIRDGNSIVSLWVERPHDRGSSVRFAGIMPGGYEGSGAEVFTLVFDVTRTGDVRFVLDNARALLHDGEGTAAPLTLHDTTLRMSESQMSDATRDVRASDTVRPESFVPHIGRDDSLFEGRYFVAFDTQDKDSGIGAYEVAESVFRYPEALYSLLSFESAKSPHELFDQSRRSYVYVNAQDEAGNERVEILSPEVPHPLYNPYALVAILLVLLGVILSLIYVRKK